MSKKNKGLRGVIYSMYDSEADFARALNWPRQRLSKITNGEKTPDVGEIDEIAKGLNKSIGEIARFFLPQ